MLFKTGKKESPNMVNVIVYNVINEKIHIFRPSTLLENLSREADK